MKHQHINGQYGGIICDSSIMGNTVVYATAALSTQAHGDGTTQSEQGRELLTRARQKESRSTETRICSATGDGDRFCFSVIPMEVQSKGRHKPPITTYCMRYWTVVYSLLSNYYRKLQSELGVHGQKGEFILSAKEHADLNLS